MQTRIRYRRTDQPQTWESNVIVSGSGNTYLVSLFLDNKSARISINGGGRIHDFSAKTLASLKKRVKEVLLSNGVVFLDETRISKKQRELMKTKESV